MTKYFIQSASWKKISIQYNNTYIGTERCTITRRYKETDAGCEWTFGLRGGGDDFKI